jgi:hypothetical protein
VMLEGVQVSDTIRGSWLLIGDPSGARGTFVLQRRSNR